MDAPQVTNVWPQREDHQPWRKRLGKEGQSYTQVLCGPHTDHYWKLPGELGHRRGHLRASGPSESRVGEPVLGSRVKPSVGLHGRGQTWRTQE